MLGRTRVQLQKARNRYRGRDIEQLLAQKRSSAAELAQVVQADIACYGSWTPQEIAIALDRSLDRHRSRTTLGTNPHIRARAAIQVPRRLIAVRHEVADVRVWEPIAQWTFHAQVRCPNQL
ncbi:Uncharacterised protein [Mycobacteroides abscessus subsp. bolletii]|uniref:Uncharacterized protein n=1 Tax=Mycobacteroides abscessus subsp. bolletii TaxID=319705 RepID=A0A9Q7SAS4_9MYCO|nr:hypothetical protein [Mycobacteroides abscessus]SHQ26834.1 Uncharacterised protein [Mycobacteroides abscessus subsp. bolletii]SHR93011.1 Uncharacterised protein [Mycobacteroides abscessus subsp. bolletii]SHS50633.1 Uncharacterised protein [Mycobacteroides abscessus subsp. bolletii]SHT82155.1 Uncharacterised protein [Mycobacteroides abscessus subsp. bolletii]SHU13816.1 Uncharacterised protein [Mycobacteroides abscessus subsp. bolletii]